MIRAPAGWLSGVAPRVTVNVVPLIAVTVTPSALPPFPSSIVAVKEPVGKFAALPAVTEATVSVVSSVSMAEASVDSASGKWTTAAR